MDNDGSPPQKTKFWPFEEAREFVRGIGITGTKGWDEYCRSGKRPIYIPSHASDVYKQEWKSWGDWFGTGTIATFKREFLPFEEAREFVQELGFKNSHAWNAYCKSEERPTYIPSNPHKAYKQQWRGMGDWLGTGMIASFNREFLPFEEARAFVRTLGLKTSSDWNNYRKSGKKPVGIPTNPSRVYKHEWQGVGDWLGTGAIAPKYKPRSYEQKLAQARLGNHRHRARKQATLGTYTTTQILDMLKRHRYRCYYCRTKFRRNKKCAYGYEFDIEHTFPISRVSGTDIPANSIDYLVPSCHPCNIKKREKFPWEWEAGGRLL